MTKLSTTLNNFVLKFLEEAAYGDGGLDLLELWNENQKEFMKLVDTNSLKKDKKKKAADAPKGARTAYILFCQEERPKVKEEFPDKDSKDVIRELAKRWNDVKEDKKLLNHYSSLAEADKKRAFKEKEEYVPKEEEKEEKKEKKKVKRTKTGYQLFCDDERSKVKEDGFVGRDIMTELGKRWTNIKENDEDMYQEYMEKAAELKENTLKEESEEKEKEEEKPKKTTKKTSKKSKKTKKIVDDDDE